MNETVIDERGRVVIPQDIRKRLGLEADAILELIEKDNALILRPGRKKKKKLSSFCGLLPQRTGTPKWPTPKEIKSMWE